MGMGMGMGVGVVRPTKRTKVPKQRSRRLSRSITFSLRRGERGAGAPDSAAARLAVLHPANTEPLLHGYSGAFVQHVRSTSRATASQAVAYLVGFGGEHDTLALKVRTPPRPLALELVRLLQGRHADSEKKSGARVGGGVGRVGVYTGLNVDVEPFSKDKLADAVLELSNL